ncbi:MAG: sugar ABC transporter ATP-binding protein [Fimbriimonadales bacterium]
MAEDARNDGAQAVPRLAGEAGASRPELLRMRGIRKEFPGVVALDGVDFTLRAGEIHSLMGENGAGKSTLIKVLTGVYAPDAGTIELDGRPIRPRSAHDAVDLGISTVYQEVNLVPYLTVAENFVLGREPRRFGAIDWREANRRTAEALERLEVRVDPASSLGSHSLAIQQMVAIARALDQNARILVLDEPTSSLDAREVERLFEVMRRLRAEGLGILFVSHFLDQVFAVSDRFTVLRNGRLVGETPASGTTRLQLVSMMLGRDVDEETLAKRPERAPQGRPMIEAQSLGRRGSVEGVSFSLAPGETVGLAGLLGSGRTESARLLFGADRADRGELKLDGRRVRLRSPRQALRLRFGFCPEDRKTSGIVPNLSVRENIVLALQARRGWLRRLSLRRQREIADRFIRALGIATPDAEKPVGTLSGGNQQKVILARWLASEPRFLILDEPTRGIDVGSKAEIERLMADLRKEGLAILFVSSELEEVVRNCHRVCVLRDRRQVALLEPDQVDAGSILRAIAGGADA